MWEKTWEEKKEPAVYLFSHLKQFFIWKLQDGHKHFHIAYGPELMCEMN